MQTVPFFFWSAYHLSDLFYSGRTYLIGTRLLVSSGAKLSWCVARQMTAEAQQTPTQPPVLLNQVVTGDSKIEGSKQSLCVCLIPHHSQLALLLLRKFAERCELCNPPTPQL